MRLVLRSVFVARHPRLLAGVASLLLCALVLDEGLGRSAHAQTPGAPALSCAVEGLSRGLRPADLCRAIGRELKRPTALVEDARVTKSGAALQIIQGDVQWIVAFLVEGRVRAWTRVSKMEAAADQQRFLVSAARELAKVAPAVETDCVQVDPNGGRKMRSSDLAYPWAELKPCRRHSIEVLDPWLI